MKMSWHTYRMIRDVVIGFLIGALVFVAFLVLVWWKDQ